MNWDEFGNMESFAVDEFFQVVWDEIGRVPRLFWEPRLRHKYGSMEPARSLKLFLSGESLRERFDLLQRQAGELGAPEGLAMNLCRAFVDLQLSSETQQRIPRQNSAESRELAIYVWRVLDDRANERMHWVQRQSPAGVICTPYGLWNQGPELCAERDKIAEQLEAGNRVGVWRLQFGFRSRPQWSFFWSIGDPPFAVQDRAAMLAYMKETQIPLSRARGPAMAISGCIRASATFILKPVEVLTSYHGSAIELITTWDGVECDQNLEFDEFVKNLISSCSGRRDS